MNKPDPTHEDIETALAGLMPIALSQESQVRIDRMIEELSADSEVAGFEIRGGGRWFSAVGAAAAIGGGVFLFMKGDLLHTVPAASAAAISDRELVLLTESERVERVSDDGLFIDSGGSAMRKVRIRLVEESRIRDEETGIVVMLTTPREEMFMVPVSTF